MSAPEQGNIAADIEVMAITDDGAETLVPEASGGTAPAADVLQTIDGNTGEWCKPDPPSRFPSTTRGANSSSIIPSILTELWSGRARR